MLLTAGVAQQQANNAGGWLPTDLTGLIHWQHWQDTTGLWQDSSRTTALTSDGQTLGYSDNRGGSSSFGFRQTSASLEPAWRSAGYAESVGQKRLDTPSTDLTPVTNDLLLGWAVKYTGTAGTYGGVYEWSSNVNSTAPFYLVTYNASGVGHFIDGNYRRYDTFVQNKYLYHVCLVTGGTGNRLCDWWFQGVKQTQYNAGATLTFEGSNYNQRLSSGYSSDSVNNNIYGFVHAEAADGTYSDTDAVNLSDYLATLGS